METPLHLHCALHVSLQTQWRSGEESFPGGPPPAGGGSNKVLGANEQRPDKVCFPAAGQRT